MELKDIVIEYDFTTDTPNYWVNFWENNNGLGLGSSDPDSSCNTLREYHRLLWSRKLPNSEVMELTRKSSYDYLSWNDYFS